MMMIPISLIGQMMGNPLGAMLNQAWAEQVNCVSLVGAWTLASAVFIASYMTRLLPFALFYGWLVGFGIGTAYSAPLVAGWTWFPLNKGLVNGIVLAGFGSGAFFFNKVGTSLVNPENLSPDQADKYTPNFSPMLRKLSLTYFVLSGIGVLLIHKSPAGMAAAAAATPAEVDASVHSMQFITVWICLVLISMGGLNAISFHKLFGIDRQLPVTDKFFSSLGGYGALSNGIGRIFWASLVDSYGFKGPWLVMCTFMGMSLVLYKLSSKSVVPFSLATCMIFCCQGGAFAMAPTISAAIFGPVLGAPVFAYLWSSFAAASIAGPPLTRALSSAGGWQLTWVVFGAGALGSGVLMQAI
jgi:hypothetical protein